MLLSCTTLFPTLCGDIHTHFRGSASPRPSALLGVRWFLATWSLAIGLWQHGCPLERQAPCFLWFFGCGPWGLNLGPTTTTCFGLVRNTVATKKCGIGSSLVGGLQMTWVSYGLSLSASGSWRALLWLLILIEYISWQRRTHRLHKNI